MKTLREFVAEFTHEQCREIIANYEQFERDGMIGDCEIRRRADEYIRGLGGYLSVVWFMKEIAFEVLLRMYHMRTG